MLSLEEQIARGVLMCPRTKQILTRRGDVLCAGEHEYKIIKGVPILLTDKDLIEQYSKPSDPMSLSYAEFDKPKSGFRKMVDNFQDYASRDYRTKQSIAAFETLVKPLGKDAFALSVGGGPRRHHDSFLNVNIGPFPNVDIVADAHMLPFPDNSVDGIFCEAVLEHLRWPHKATAEMFRVLKPGGRIFACTPFMQHYHGYPHHYQNFTLTGHVCMFEDAGYKVTESGVCVGPMVAMVDLATQFASNLTPRFMRRFMYWAVRIPGAWIRMLDKRLNRAHFAFCLASSTYLLAEKPKS